MSTVPCGLFRELWVHEIIEHGLARCVCITRVVLRRTCRWLYAHCPAPVPSVASLIDEYCALVALPSASPLLCFHIHEERTTWLSVLNAAQDRAVQLGRLAAFYALCTLRREMGVEDTYAPDFVATALDAGRLSVIQAVWRLSKFDGATTRALAAAQLVAHALEHNNKALFDWIVSFPLTTWYFNGGRTSHTAPHLRLTDAVISDWTRRAKAGPDWALCGWHGIVRQIIDRHPRTVMARLLKAHRVMLESVMTLRGLPLV